MKKNVSIKTYNLADGAKIQYIKNFLSHREAEKIYDELFSVVPWIQGEYKIYGKNIKVPRYSYTLKDNNFQIPKTYQVIDSMTWPPLTKKLKNKVERQTGYQIHYAQLNYYRDENDSVGFHSDDSVQPNDIIASVSLGAPRKFILKHKKNNKLKKELILENGSLLIMNEAAAKTHWKHSIPKLTRETQPRINITFRPK